MPGSTAVTDPVWFERERLASFERNGFVGSSRRLTDGAGRTTYAIVRGEGRHPTVLLHGGLSEASEWSLLAGRLGAHVVIPDRPGCGLSYPIDYLKVDDYRAAAADWVSELLESLGADDVDLVANSMGGFFALAFALAHPERVRRLALVGAPAGLHREIPIFLRLWGHPIAGALISRMKIDDPEVLRKRVFASLLVAHPERVPRDFLEIAVAASALPGAGDAATTMLRVVTTLRGWRPALDLREDATGLAVPTQFAWGDADAFAPPVRGQAIAAQMPDARFDVLPETGHLPHLDAPEEVATALNAFLSRPGSS